MNEIWKDVEGYDGIYQISNLGRVKRFYLGNRKTRIIKPIVNNDYLYNDLCINSKAKRFSVHGLVCKHFIPNPLNKPSINHINCDKTDNRVENLEWCTAKENSQHARENGLYNDYGENSCNSKITDIETEVIRRVYAGTSLSQRYLGSLFGIGQPQVSRIIRYERRK